MAVHIDDGLLHLTGIELVGTADLVEKLGHFFRCVPGQVLRLFLVNELANFFHHLVFSRDDVPVEHILVVLVEVVINFFLQPAHDVELIQDFLRELCLDNVQDLVGFLVD